MNIRDIENLSKAIGPIVKNAIEASAAELKNEFALETESLRSKVKSLEAQIESLNAENVELKDKAFSMLEVKINESVVTEMVDGIKLQIEELVSSIPEVPELDTEAIIASLEDVISLKVKEFTDSVELPKDGTSITLDDLQPVIDAATSKLEEQTAEFIEQSNITLEAIKDIKIPEDGKSVTVEDVQPILDQALLALETKALDYVKAIELPKDGKDGADGADGASVTIEDIVPLIEQSLPSEDFILELVSKAVSEIKLPEDGKNGVDGVDGRDAVAIEILPTIDLEKSYPRGSYAKYNNGLWRAFETTFELRGWECIVAGVNDVKITAIGDKDFELVVEDSIGKEFKKEFKLPIMLYKNVYQDSGTYEAGNVVTFGGSAWHSNVDENKSKPGTNSDWSLCVKKGRDYKEPTPTNKSKSQQVSIK